MARPTKLNQELIDSLVLAVRTGNYVETAAAFAGVSKDSFYRWLKLGARCKTKHDLTAHERLCVSLSDAIGRAIADSEVKGISDVIRAGSQPTTVRSTTTTTKEDGTTVVVEKEEERPGDWRALAWHMERRFTKRWGQRQSLELSGPEGEPIPVEVRVAEVAKRVRALRAVEGGAEDVAGEAAAAMLQS